MGFKTYQQFLENDIRLECALNFYFNEGQGDHNAQSDTWNLIRVSNCTAQDLGFKVFWNYNASPNSNRDDLRKKILQGDSPGSEQTRSKSPPKALTPTIRFRTLCKTLRFFFKICLKFLQVFRLY